MTTKAAIPKPVKLETPLPDELKTAYQVHTLAQMLYVGVTATPPWTPGVPTPFSPILH
jgi:hypothetical protein